MKSVELNKSGNEVVTLNQMRFILRNKVLRVLLNIKGKKPGEMAEYARKNTEFYKKFYGDIDLRDIEGIPLVTKKVLPENPYEMLSREFADKVFLYGATSGSTGSPTPSFLTPDDFKKLIALSSFSPYMERVKKALETNRTAVCNLAFGFTIAGLSFKALLEKYGALVAPLGTRSTIATPTRIANSLGRLFPSIIAATPYDFMIFMEILREDNLTAYRKAVSKLKIVMSTAEPCSKSRENQIKKYFKLDCYINTYASVEGLVTIPCPCGEMHVLENLYDMRLYDENLEYIGDKGKGRLCFTSQLRKTTPLINYLLDDLVTIRESRCIYGYKKTIEPHGRYELSLNLNNKIWGNLDFEEIIYRHGLFMTYFIDIFDDEMVIKLEEYPIAVEEYSLLELSREMEEATGLRCTTKLLPLGELTNLREPRRSKPVIKVKDNRAVSRQEMPTIL